MSVLRFSLKSRFKSFQNELKYVLSKSIILSTNCLLYGNDCLIGVYLRFCLEKSETKKLKLKFSFGLASFTRHIFLSYIISSQFKIAVSYESLIPPLNKK